MKLIGYRFKNHIEENWAYTYDLDEVSHGKGIKEYGYVDPIYIDDEKNYIQVEIPKVPRWVADMLTDYQTRDYDKFKQSVSYACFGFVHFEKKKNWILKNAKKLDTAITLGVWEIE